MCPIDEIKDRTENETSAISIFEKRRDNQTAIELMTKRFKRAAAGNELKVVEYIRPPIILYRMTEYLREVIAD